MDTGSQHESNASVEDALLSAAAAALDSSIGFEDKKISCSEAGGDCEGMFDDFRPPLALFLDAHDAGALVCVSRMHENIACLFLRQAESWSARFRLG